MAAQGDTVTLECRVDAHPEPKMVFWRDHAGRIPVIQGGKNDIKFKPIKDVSKCYTYISIWNFMLPSTYYP